MVCWHFHITLKFWLWEQRVGPWEAVGGQGPHGVSLMAWRWHHFADHPHTFQTCLLPA